MILRAAATALAGATGLYLLAWRIAVSLDEKTEPRLSPSTGA